MTVAGVLAAIASVGAIVSGIVWLIRRFSDSRAEDSEEIQKEVAKEKDEVMKGGRPQW